MKFVNFRVAELARVREIPEFARIRLQNLNVLSINRDMEAGSVS